VHDENEKQELIDSLNKSPNGSTSDLKNKSSSDLFIQDEKYEDLKAMQEVVVGSEGLTLTEQLKICLNNKEYMLTAVGNASVILFLFLYLSVYAQVLYPFGFTEESFTSLAGLLTQSIGIASGVASAIVLIIRPDWMVITTFLVAITSLGSIIFYDIAAMA